MHAKIGDPLSKSVPAAAMLLMALTIGWGAMPWEDVIDPDNQVWRESASNLRL